MGLPQICGKVTGKPFHIGLDVQPKDATHIMFLEMPPLLETRLQILTILLFFIDMEALLWIFLQVGGGTSFHDTHVMNNVHLLMTEALYQKITLMFRVLLGMR